MILLLFDLLCGLLSSWWRHFL